MMEVERCLLPMVHEALVSLGVDPRLGQCWQKHRRQDGQNEEDCQQIETRERKFVTKRPLLGNELCQFQSR